MKPGRGVESSTQANMEVTGYPIIDTDPNAQHFETSWPLNSSYAYHLGLFRKDKELA